MKSLRWTVRCCALLLAAACGGGGGSPDPTAGADVPDPGASDVADEGATGSESGDPAPVETLDEPAIPDTAVPDEAPGDPAPDPVPDPAPDPSEDVTPDVAAEATGDVPAEAGEDAPAEDPGDDAATDETPVPDSAADAGTDEGTHMSAKKAEMFDETKVLEFRLTFTAAEWQKFLGFIAKGEKSDVHCTFEYNGEVFADAACKPKGNPDYWPDQKKPQFTVRFNKWDSAGRFHGLRRINLEASPFHAAPIRDRLGMWFAREAGVDASACNHVNLFIDGKDYGPYMNIEPLDREFLEDHFPADEYGTLYEEGYKPSDSGADTTRLDNLEAIVDMEPLDGDHTLFFLALDAMMDIPQVLREMAVEVLLSTPDNFTNGSWNFYYYDHPERGFLVLPWDFDDILGDAPATSDIYEYWGPPDWGNPPNKMRQLINRNPVWKAEYEANLAWMLAGPHAELAARAQFYCDQIRATVAADPYKAADIEDFDADCAYVKQHLAERAAYVKQILGP